MTSLAVRPPTVAQVRAGPEVPTELLLRTRARLPAGHPEREILRARAVEDNLPLAARLARCYCGRGEHVDDLVQVAALALLRAVDGFDPGRLTPFAHYAVPSIVGALKRHFRDNTWGMHVPRSTQQVFLQLPTAIGDLTHRWSRAPTSAELADHLGIDLPALLTATKAARAYRLLSLDAADDGDDDVVPADAIGAVDPRFAGVEDRLTLTALVVGLPSREQRVLVLRFYDEWTQSRIAAEIGVSQMQVSRLLRRSLHELRGGIQDPAQRPAPARRP